MILDLHEIQRQKRVVERLHKKVAAGELEWCLALDAAFRELERLKAGR